MKREILNHKPGVTGCCPGHDEFPDDTYKSNRSKRARSRDIKKEHRMVRRIVKNKLHNDIEVAVRPEA